MDATSTGGDAREMGVSRRGVIAGAAGISAAALVVPSDANAGTPRVLAGRDGVVVAEVIGHIAQEGLELAGYGFFTRFTGLSDRLMFEGARDESGARFTWTATATVADKFIRESLISVTAPGRVSVYDGDGGGDFSNPDSFSDGKRIATFSGRFQNVLTIIAPDQAVTAIDSDLRQRHAGSFRAGGKRRRFGKRDRRLHLSASGPGRRLDPDVPRAVFDVAGHFAVVD